MTTDHAAPHSAGGFRRGSLGGVPSGQAEHRPGTQRYIRCTSNERMFANDRCHCFSGAPDHFSAS
jgi:hypothetical protein